MRFKSLAIALKELEPFIRDGEHLQTGRGFKSFDDLRSRELLTNWLLCVVCNHDRQSPDRMTFTTDPDGGDGRIYDTETEQSFPTEHVIVPRPPTGTAVDIEAQILEKIDQKRNKGGAAYASGKTLVVFLYSGGGEWKPNRVARNLPKPLHFEAVWIVGLHHVEASGEYVYGVTQLDESGGNSPMSLVHIGKDFDAWRVEQIQ
jgi:hypothetical protein